MSLDSWMSRRKRDLRLGLYPRGHGVWLGAAAALLVLGTALMMWGATPWLAPVAAGLCVALAIGQHSSWPFALAASVILVLAITALAVRFTPDWNIGLVCGATFVWVSLGAAGLVCAGLTPHPRVIGMRALRVGVPITAAPIAVVVFLAVKAQVGADYEWAMRNDAVWNLVTTRIMISDGGLNAIAHPSASPLTPGLLAIVAATGRASVAPSELLRHDVAAFANFWLAGLLMSGVLAALIGARSVHGASRGARIFAAMVTGLLPMTWFMFGFAAEYGFYNATVALVLLLATWLAWLETRVAPVLGAAVLSMAGVAMLATWAPLALIPFALAVFALVARITSLVRDGRRGGQILLLVAAAAPVPLYVTAVTLPDLRREGSALAVDGGFFPLRPTHVALIVTIVLAVAILQSVQRNQVHHLNGVLVVLGASAAAAAYLIFQRRSATSLWGYYPAKLSWLVLCLLMVILAAALASEMVRARGRTLATIGTAGVAVAVPLALMMPAPPSSDRTASMFAPFAIATGAGFAGGNLAAERLFEIAEPGVPTIALGLDAPDEEKFINGWLLQLESEDAADPIRDYSYMMQPGDESQACSAIHVWNRAVRVVTQDPDLPERLAQSCPGVDMVVEVLPHE